jgi:hypothetical protein
MTKTAEELRNTLKECGLPDEEVERIVKAQTDAGAVNTSGIDMGACHEIAEKLAKSLSEDDADVYNEDVDDDPGDAEDFVDFGEVLARMAKAADVLTERQTAYIDEVKSDTETLQKAWLAGLTVIEEQSKVISNLGELAKSQGERIDAIAERLAVPVPPRSVSGDAAAQQSPGEEAIAKGKEVDRDAVLAKAHAEIRLDDTPQERRETLFKAVSAIDAGISPAEVATNYGISVG